MFLKDFARNLESKESLYQALKRLERAGLDVSTINSTSVKLFTDDAGRHHANKDCSSRQDGYYSTRNPVWRKRPYVLGSQERRMSVGHLLGIHSSSVCWRCTQREVDRMISAEFETLLAVFEVESLEGVNISARADQNSLTRPHIILAILSKSPAGRNSARIRTAQQTLKLHLEKASLSALDAANDRAVHSLLKVRHPRAPVGCVDLSWLPRNPVFFLESMYAAYCQTGSKTGAGNAAALKEAMTILDVSGIRPSPDQWSDLTSVVSSWDDKLDSLKETLARFRVIVAVSGSKRSSLSGYGKDTDTAVSILTADARLDRSYAYIHLPVAAILELENIPGSDFEVLGRTDLKTAQELVDLATALAANEGDLRDLRVSLHAASLVLATGLEPALEGF